MIHLEGIKMCAHHIAEDHFGILICLVAVTEERVAP